MTEENGQYIRNGKFSGQCADTTTRNGRNCQVGGKCPHCNRFDNHHTIGCPGWKREQRTQMEIHVVIPNLE